MLFTFNCDSSLSFGGRERLEALFEELEGKKIGLLTANIE
jgi:hypothetical protein